MEAQPKIQMQQHQCNLYSLNMHKPTLDISGLKIPHIFLSETNLWSYGYRMDGCSEHYSCFILFHFLFCTHYNVTTMPLTVCLGYGKHKLCISQPLKAYDPPLRAALAPILLMFALMVFTDYLSYPLISLKLQPTW